MPKITSVSLKKKFSRYFSEATLPERTTVVYILPSSCHGTLTVVFNMYIQAISPKRNYFGRQSAFGCNGRWEDNGSIYIVTIPSKMCSARGSFPGKRVFFGGLYSSENCAGKAFGEVSGACYFSDAAL